ncbi:303_t:CDS:1, partial [Cetraspora pellucida]
VSEKLTVIQEAKRIGVLAASCHFGIDQSMVSRWKNNEKKINNVVSGNRRVGVGRTSFYLAAKEELIKWLNELRQIGIAVTSGSIKMQIYTILSTTCADKYPGASQQFHASKSWFYQFLKRHQLSLRRRTKISQKLLEDLTEKIIEFHKFVIQARLKY